MIELFGQWVTIALLVGANIQLTLVIYRLENLRRDDE